MKTVASGQWPAEDEDLVDCWSRVTDPRPSMVKQNGENKVLRCSFCHKDQNDVRKLIAGPTVFICDECVEVCNDIIADDNRFDGPEDAWLQGR